MSDDFFQYAESQMQGPTTAGAGKSYTCWAVSGECETLPQAMTEATEQLHELIDRHTLAHVREATARGDVAENHWVSSNHQVTRLPGSDIYPPTWVVSMMATVEVHQYAPEGVDDSETEF